MKKRSLLICFFAAVLIFLQSCEKEKVSPAELAGQYQGVFQVSDSKTGYRNSGSVELQVTEAGYICLGNQQRLPAGGAGSFKRKSDVIEFADENVWPPQFDMHLVLTGAFQYELDDTRLHMWKDVATMRYEYLLEKR